MPFLITAERGGRSDRGRPPLRPVRDRLPAGFVAMLKLLRILPYRLYFPLVARSTRG